MGRLRDGVGGGVLFWSGELPECCECCGLAITTVFVDCKTVHGEWGVFCVECAGDLAVAVDGGLCRVYQRLPEGWVSIF